MIHIEQVEGMLGVSIQSKAPILLIKGEKGSLGCAYFSIETANRIDDVLAVVSGVSNFEEMLEAEVKAVSNKARSYGVEEGMKGKNALELMNP